MLTDDEAEEDLRAGHLEKAAECFGICEGTDCVSRVFFPFQFFLIKTFFNFSHFLNFLFWMQEFFSSIFLLKLSLSVFSHYNFFPFSHFFHKQISENTKKGKKDLVGRSTVGNPSLRSTIN